MGWSWAVYLAQNFLMGQMMKISPLAPAVLLVEGAPCPRLSRAHPFSAVVHIDDFGILRVIDCDEDLRELREVRDLLKVFLLDLGLGVHKAVDGQEVVALGHVRGS